MGQLSQQLSSRQGDSLGRLPHWLRLEPQMTIVNHSLILAADQQALLSKKNFRQ